MRSKNLGYENWISVSYVCWFQKKIGSKLKFGLEKKLNMNRVKGRGATNCNIDACANIIAVYTDCYCIVHSVQYQLCFFR